MSGCQMSSSFYRRLQAVKMTVEELSWPKEINGLGRGLRVWHHKNH